ncbi:MAG: hypothetical protein U5P10_03510 [Spirochaetia bacterium]|nr:hypothetical protein [Spirochaetia bacterium]
MDKRKSEINEHQSAIDELDVTIERQTAELGRLILQNDECPQEVLKETFGVGKEIQSEIAAKENRREDIRSALKDCGSWMSSWRSWTKRIRLLKKAGRRWLPAWGPMPIGCIVLVL